MNTRAENDAKLPEDTLQRIATPVTNEDIAAEANNNDGFQKSFTLGAQWMRTQLWPRIRVLLDERQTSQSEEDIRKLVDEARYAIACDFTNNDFEVDNEIKAKYRDSVVTRLCEALERSGIKQALGDTRIAKVREYLDRLDASGKFVHQDNIVSTIREIIA